MHIPADVESRLLTAGDGSARIRYIAQGASLDSHPYAVVTAHLDELRAALTGGQQPPSSDP